MTDAPNAAQRRLWTDIAGPAWVNGERMHDLMIGPHGDAVVAALAPRAGERVLDIGCGYGTTALHVAELVGPGGHVHGVDISPTMIDRARERAGTTGDVSFAVGDAQVDRLAGDQLFDAVVSRFGVMFFADPHAAFVNIRDSVAPGGRLAFVCWQGPALNPQFTIAAAVIRPRLAVPPPLPDPLGPGPMSFADPERIDRTLTGSGWLNVEITPDTLPMRFDVDGTDGVAAATEHLMGSEAGRLARAELDADELDALIADLRAAHQPYMRDGHLEFDTGVWIVTARA
jgi:SAM-dependent methyltransferase